MSAQTATTSSEPEALSFEKARERVKPHDGRRDRSGLKAND